MPGDFARRTHTLGWGYLYSSLLVAFLSASTGYVLPVSNYKFLEISEALCLVWVVIVVVAIVRQGRRGFDTCI